MDSLNSERLILIPLDVEKLELAIKNYNKMQRSLGLKENGSVLSEEMKYAMEIRLKRVLENIEDYMWYTNWAIIEKKSMEIVGYIMIKGKANENGEVIIGYGIDDKHHRKGFASEAVRGIIDFIFNDKNARFVVADTEKENMASHRVLINNGAKIYEEDETLIWWKIENYKIV